jgi:hypothetical protein
LAFRPSFRLFQVRDRISMQNTFVLIGSILGFASFAWRLIEVVTSHATIGISVEPVTGLNGHQHATALITIDNTAGTTRRIRYAALLIAPQKEPLRMAARSLIDRSGLKSPRESSNTGLPALLNFKPDESKLTEDGTHMLVPVPFFYKEQFTIGNEKITARLPIDTHLLAKQVYNVYFIVYIQYAFKLYIRWRITSDALFLD